MPRDATLALVVNAFVIEVKRKIGGFIMFQAWELYALS